MSAMPRTWGRRSPSEVLLTAWEARSAGGVCFEHAEMFGRRFVLSS